MFEFNSTNNVESSTEFIALANAYLSSNKATNLSCAISANIFHTINRHKEGAYCACSHNSKPR